MLSLSVQLFKVLTWVALFFLISGATICPGRGLSPAARREGEGEKERARRVARDTSPLEAEQPPQKTTQNRPLLLTLA